MMECELPAGRPSKYSDGVLSQDELLDFINTFEGFARVDIEYPETAFPFLPVQWPNKITFRPGAWQATYTFLDIRKALELGLGYTITHICEILVYFEST